MDLIQLIIVLAIVMLVLFLIQTYIPASPVRTVIIGIIVFVLCLWLLRLAGIGTVRIGGLDHGGYLATAAGIGNVMVGR